MSSNAQLLIDSLKQFVVTPLNAFGVGGFVFDNEGDTSLNLSADITDHYTEDNKSVQDHIAIKPKKLTLKGYVGELVYRDGNTAASSVQKVVQKLTTVTQYLPQLSAAAQQAIDVINNARAGNFSLNNVSLESVNKVLDLWGLAKNINPNQTKQAQAYMYFKALYEQKILCSVQTPYEFLSNMAIESIIAIQGENSKYITDFSITLKQIRTVQIVNVQGSTSGRGVSDSPTPISAGRNSQQSQPINTVGNMPGLDPTTLSAMQALGVDSNAIVRAADQLKNMPQFEYDKIITILDRVNP